ncbi:hypothetical protein [Phenylobacterium sp. J367]|uniref:hypothetical protein n=1 Tax=Phenylobacterium sp. J367 TaxID=2898435 RepID=UPI0021518CF8|nr:hypothetical protein [Phenylobacterium sp. J367]MCR5879534.1 hypothetical protein [Phenylobacterium sp. J367]
MRNANDNHARAPGARILPILGEVRRDGRIVLRPGPPASPAAPPRAPQPPEGAS